MNALLFSKNHIWVKQEPDGVLLGISDYAQDKLGCVMFVNLPDVGEEYAADETFGDIESVKTVSDLITPVSGTVVAVNEDVVDNPEQINEAPYESWLLKLSCDTLPASLMDEETYQKYTESL